MKFFFTLQICLFSVVAFCNGFYITFLSESGEYLCNGAAYNENTVITSASCAKRYPASAKYLDQSVVKVTPGPVHENGGLAIVKLDEDLNIKMLFPVRLVEEGPSSNDPEAVWFNGENANREIVSIVDGNCKSWLGENQDDDSCGAFLRPIPTESDGKCNLRDSGTPIFVDDKLLGIVTHGTDCVKESIGIYARIPKYASWIKG